MREALLFGAGALVVFGLACGGAAGPSEPTEPPKSVGQPAHDDGDGAVPHVVFSDVEIGFDGIYGLQADGTVWMLPHRKVTPALSEPVVSLDAWTRRESRWSSLEFSLSHGCAVTVGGAVECFGNDPSAPEVAGTPKGDGWATVTVGLGVSCALDKAGTPRCWGRKLRGRDQAAGGPYDGLLQRGETTCGTVQGKVERCWGGFSQEVGPYGAGPYVDYSSEGQADCAILVDGGLQCGGEGICGPGYVELCRPGPGVPLPDAPLAHVTVDLARGCGTGRQDGAVRCWGEGKRGRPAGAQAPEGRFTDLAGRHGFFCGVREDGALMCWGDLAGSSG